MCKRLGPPWSTYVHYIVQRPQIDVLVWVGHIHIISSKHESFNELHRAAQNHNCDNNTIRTVISLKHTIEPLGVI